MRICLVSHGFPPLERTGVENYTAALATELARAGHAVEVFAPRAAPDLPHLSMRREERDGYGVTWLSANRAPENQEEHLDPPGVASRFGEFLDRERPEVVHFQHLIKLGLGLVEEVRSRGVPALYTAHDYYAVCHRFTLTRPDLTRCTTIGDPAACARCDLALSHLNRLPELGDYQMGALPGQLDAEAAAGLAGILEGRPEEAGFDPAELADFVERRTELDRRRREAYRSFDLVLSPTRFLADRLVEGGLEPDRVRLLPYGAETRELRDLPPVRVAAGELPHLGYLGGLAKHKGVHVLLDAYERLEERPRLTLWGDTSDLVYLETLRERARTLGVDWRGPFRRGELRDCLAEVDVVVVPSIWVENFPFVIREALAAGRPVVASDVGALPESVRDGVDGLLFAPGDGAALAAVLTRLCTEEGLVQTLAAGTPEVKDVATQATELAEIYGELIEERPPTKSAPLPAHLSDFGALHAELDDLPTRELFRRVMARLGDLRGALVGGGRRGAAPVPLEDLVEGSKAQTLISDLRRERDWLQGTVRSHEEAADALRERLAWRESELEQRQEEIEWLRGAKEDLKQGLASLREEATWLRGELEGRDLELAWLRESVANYERDLAWTQERKHAAEETIERLTREADALTRRANEAEERERRTVDTFVPLIKTTLETHPAEVEGRARALLEHLRDELDPDRTRELEELLTAATSDLLDRLAELTRRRDQMASARDELEATLLRALLRRTALGRRVGTWDGEAPQGDGQADGEGRP